MTALWTSAEIAAATGGRATQAFAAEGISIDTRNLAPGDLFVALKDLRDGHDFVRAARAVPDLDLLFAPVKRHATDLIIEKAAELGVARIRPVITQRTIAETVRLDRLQAIAREAAEQTERFDAAEVVDAVPLAKALDGWDAGRPLIYADEAGDDATQPWGGASGRAPPLAGVVANLQTEKLALLIGPEGGFSPEERRMLRALPFVKPVSLGPRILRAETAVIAALSVIQSAWGDWR